MAEQIAEPINVVASSGSVEKKGGMLPLILVVLLVPALNFATAQFLVIPRLKAEVATLVSDSPDHRGSGGKKDTKRETGGHNGKEQGTLPYTVEFADVIVNLAGAKGTRYLRARFTLASSEEAVTALVKGSESQLKDIAIGVLSAQTLESLEAPGARNDIRTELVRQFNRALHGEVVEQLYFSEFVVQ